MAKTNGTILSTIAANVGYPFQVSSGYNKPIIINQPSNGALNVPMLSKMLDTAITRNKCPIESASATPIKLTVNIAMTSPVRVAGSGWTHSAGGLVEPLLTTLTSKPEH